MYGITGLLLLAFAQTVNSQDDRYKGPPCASNANCSVFDYCNGEICVPNHKGCPDDTCLPFEVCVRGQCMEIPVPRPCRPGTDADCMVFEYCKDALCVPDNRECPGATCPTNYVCADKKCILHPLRSSSTTPAEPSVAATGETVEPTETTEGPPPVLRPCRRHWKRAEAFKACYLPIHASLNYHYANFACQSMGSHLVAIESKEEMEYVNGLMDGAPFWIGARFYGVWFWQNGRTPFKYQNWRPSQPNGCCGKDVTCVLVNMSGESGYWDDAGCDEMHKPNQGFVCKEFL